ncbi:MAG: MFS transporter [Pseudomonadota bacterium]
MAEAASGYQIPLKTKLAFGIGASGESITNFAFATYTFFFYNQVLGLSGTLAGLATTISICFDAVSDPLVGSLSDRLRSRLGRRHPFMYAAAIPLGIVYFCIFSPPTGLSEWALFAWFTGFSVLMRLLLTCFAIPHLALGAELSEDYLQRSTIMSYNAIFGWVGGASIFLIANLVYFSRSPGFDNGLLNGAAYPEFGLTASLLITSCILLSAWWTRDQIPRLPQVDKNAPPFGLAVLFKELGQAIGNRNYLVLLLGLFCLSLTLGTRETINLHMNTFFWELVPEELVWFALGSGLGFVFAFSATRRFHDRYDKRTTAMGALVFLSLFAAAPVVGRMLGIMPGNDDPWLLPILVFFSGAGYCTGAILNISVMSMLADIADQHELKTGLRKEGIFYSARAFFGKATSALGHLIGGIAIDVIGFPTGAQPGTVDEEILFELGLIDGPIAAIPALIAIYFYARYSITRAEHREIRRALDARAGKGVAAESDTSDEPATGRLPAG